LLTLGVCSELHDQFIASSNGNPQWLTNVDARTVREIKHYEVVRWWICILGLPDKHPRKWTKHALITLQEAMEA
jgi:hypothetical protein